MMDRMTQHGGDWKSFCMEYGREPLDFSASLSPLGMPEAVRAAACNAVLHADRYPDPQCRELTRAIAQHSGIPASYILCGNGAAELIFRIVHALRPKRALLTAPTFGEYEIALQSVGCTVDHHLLYEQNNFCLDETVLDAITRQTALLFLCEPNNPTGQISDRQLRLRILEHCQRTNTILIADECFLDFSPMHQKQSLTDQLERYPNLMILHSFTKRYAMAGLRLGYCVTSNEELIRRMQRSGQPWSVSSPAQAAGVAALGEQNYRIALDELICRERNFLQHGLREMGLRVIDSSVNYLLLQAGRNLCGDLREKGILVRGCGNFQGLDDRWHRIAVRTREENVQLLHALKEILR